MNLEEFEAAYPKYAGYQSGMLKKGDIFNVWGRRHINHGYVQILLSCGRLRDGLSK